MKEVVIIVLAVAALPIVIPLFCAGLGMVFGMLKGIGKFACYAYATALVAVPCLIAVEKLAFGNYAGAMLTVAAIGSIIGLSYGAVWLTDPDFRKRSS